MVLCLILCSEWCRVAWAWESMVCGTPYYMAHHGWVSWECRQSGVLLKVCWRALCLPLKSSRWLGMSLKAQSLQLANDGAFIAPPLVRSVRHLEPGLKHQLLPVALSVHRGCALEPCDELCAAKDSIGN